VSDAIIHDHNELKTYYDKIMSSEDHATQTEFQNQFVWELARHSIAEEIVVYPAMEKHIPNGKDMAEKDRQEHRSVRVSSSTFTQPTDRPPFADTHLSTSG
jgi:hemerythrin superfamily protein